jgi:hypothetical protein
MADYCIEQVVDKEMAVKVLASIEAVEGGYWTVSYDSSGENEGITTQNVIAHASWGELLIHDFSAATAFVGIPPETPQLLVLSYDKSRDTYTLRVPDNEKMRTALLDITGLTGEQISKGNQYQQILITKLGFADNTIPFHQSSQQQ